MTGAKSREITDLERNMVTGGVGMGANAAPGGGPDWFGPEEPFSPVAPPAVRGRTLDFPPGYNLQIVQWPYEGVKPWELRALAESYDLVRLAIETRKDQMERLTWSFVPKMNAAGIAVTTEDDPAIQELTDFFEFPDGENDWGVWLRKILEDVFVIDAVALYCDRNTNQLLKLKQIDGAIINRVIDDWGDTPAPPYPAYVELLRGMPAVQYRADDMIYMPRNPRVHRVFGLSPVHQIMLTINTALRRQVSTLQYWSEGNIPAALVGTPDNWTSEQIRDFQKWFDGLLAGDTAARRRMLFVPNGANKIVPTKEPELWQKFDEWLARVVCFAFSLPPTPFISQNNRATAESAHDAALEEGLAPLQNFVKRLVGRALRMFWPAYAKKIQFSWDDDREIDALVQEQVLTGYVTKGIRTINEARATLGDPPKPDGDELKVLIATGYIPIGINDDAPTAGEAAQQSADQAKQSAEALAAHGPNQAAAAPASGGQGAGATTGANVAAKPDDDKGAPAAKAATFRPSRETQRRIAKTYWGAPRRPHAQPPGGDEG